MIMLGGYVTDACTGPILTYHARTRDRFGRRSAALPLYPKVYIASAVALVEGLRKPQSLW